MPNGRSTPALLSTPPPLRRPLQPAIQPATSPRTPRRGSSPGISSYLNSATNRKSSDSWNSWSSSNAEEEFEWKPEQVKFLARTLDALPANVTTPFNGRVPPPNLLDKIARSVTEAKGPVEWPHSIRSTRIRLLELARARAREDTIAERSKWDIIEEEQTDGVPQAPKPKTTKRRPLYRQSSMDFVNDSIGETKDYSGIDRLSSRLNSSERTFPNPSYQYPRALQPLNRSTSPPRALNPSKPSSSTLNSLWSESNLSCSSRPGRRRSVSTLATSEISESSHVETRTPSTPAVTKSRKAEPTSTPPPLIPRPFKRAPSFGAIAQEARHSGMDQDGVSYPSSDEEERLRNSKKAKTKDILLSPIQSAAKISKRGVEDKPGKRVEYAEAKRPSKRNAQRNPSMFGAELPYISPHPSSPPPSIYSPSPVPISSPATQPSSPPLLTPGSPSSPRNKTLRRMRRFDLSVARRISFTSSHDADEETDGDYHPFAACAPNLGSAFQLI